MSQSAAQLLGPAYPGTMTTAREITLNFLKARMAINNARMAFIIDPTPANMTAWTDAEEALDDLHMIDYYDTPENHS